jgi:hypothetical protein
MLTACFMTVTIWRSVDCGSDVKGKGGPSLLFSIAGFIGGLSLFVSIQLRGVAILKNAL